MSEPKETAEESTLEEQMEQRIQATYEKLDSKEHLVQQLGREGMEAIIRRGLYNTQVWHDANVERGDQNEIIGLCRDYLREVYGVNCELVEVTGNEQFSHQLVFDRNGPLRVVPTSKKRVCKDAARRKLESVLDQELESNLDEENQDRDTIKSDILSKRYLDVVGSKEENQEKIIEFIVEESMVGFNSIIKRQERNFSERSIQSRFQGNVDIIWME